MLSWAEAALTRNGSAIAAEMIALRMLRFPPEFLKRVVRLKYWPCFQAAWALDSSITQALTSLERAFVGRAKEPPEWLIPQRLPVLMPVLGETAKPDFVQFRFFEIRLAFRCKSPAQYGHPAPRRGDVGR